MKKKRILTGITATGDLTLGNYIGSIQQLKKLQDDYEEKEIFVFVADLHALTTPMLQIPKTENKINNQEDINILEKKVKNVIKIYLASGLNPRKVKLFKQSDISGHTELFYYLLTHTNVGELNRMTQFKDKIVKMKNKTELIPTGILVYPVLMVADIMLYNSNIVPVGLDQKQHIELAKDLIERMNRKYNMNFNIPKPMISSNDYGSKIMALKEPNKKMSKSDNNESNTIFLVDSDESIKRKIMTALTDSENKVYYDKKNKPGVSKLITIYSSLKKIKILEAEEKLKNLNYKDFKEKVAETIINSIRPIREKFLQLNDNDIEDVLNINREEVQNIARDNLDLIKRKIGIKYD